MTDPYYKANPGDPITADDWNNMQRKLREAVQTHNHEGGESGAQIDGDAIAPTARLKVNQVDAAVALTVRNVDVLERLTSLDRQKLPVAGGTITGPISVSGTAGIGTADPKARLEVRGTTGDASASALKVTNAAGDSLLEVRNDGAITAATLTVKNVDVHERLTSLDRQKLPVAGGTITGPISVSGTAGIGTADPKARLEVRGTSSDASASALKVTNAAGANLLEVRNDGATALFDRPLFLRTMGDGNHGIGFEPSADGPRVFGHQGGQLASTQGGTKVALKWSGADVSVLGTLKGEQDLFLGRNENNKKFILHSRHATNGDFLQITSDKADGTWDWTSGLVLKRGGSVGIGTTDPKARLELRGSTNDASASALKATNAAGANLFEVRNDGATSVQGDLLAGNSALYFTQTEHGHSGFGNAPGFAAIENGKDHDALMILGRMTAAKLRVVKLWDRLEVCGNQAVTGTLGIGTAAPPNKRLTIDNPVNNHANLELRQSGGQSWGVGLVINTTGAGDGAAMMFRSRQKNWQLRGETGPTATGFQITEDGGDAEYGSGFGTPRLHIKAGGDIGIGTTDPQSKLDIQGAPRSGTHPKGRALYVTGEFGEADGVEFRHSNGTQGIGFGHNAIYATGTNEHQDLNLRSRGDGVVRVERKLPKGGKAVFLELIQHPTVNADVYPSLRFHHWGRYWTRIEASNGRFHFKQGDLGSDEYVDLSARNIHIASQDAWAVGSPEGVRTIRGTVAANNTVIAGAGFSVAWVGTGLCDITFARPFNGPPTVVATQQFTGNGTGGNTLDNAVIVFANARQARIKTGDGGGGATPREFHFIAIGP